MTVKNLKDLEAVMKLCQKHGIHKVTVGNVTLDVTLVEAKEATKPNDMNTPAHPYEQFTEEELLTWSVPNS
jgi:hypothetical protein